MCLGSGLGASLRPLIPALGKGQAGPAPGERGPGQTSQPGDGGGSKGATHRLILRVHLCRNVVASTPHLSSTAELRSCDKWPAKPTEIFYLALSRRGLLISLDDEGGRNSLLRPVYVCSGRCGWSPHAWDDSMHRSACILASSTSGHWAGCFGFLSTTSLLADLEEEGTQARRCGMELSPEQR